MKFKKNDEVKTYFGVGIIKEFLEKEDIILYQVEMTDTHKGKLLWFAENEIELLDNKEGKSKLKYSYENDVDDILKSIIRQK